MTFEGHLVGDAATHTTTNAGGCPVYDAVMDGGQIPLGCPFQGELGCPMAVNVVDPLEETIAYHPAEDQDNESDVFLEIDDSGRAVVGAIPARLDHRPRANGLRLPRRARQPEPRLRR